MNLSDEQKGGLKKAIFDGMSQRRQKHILKKGYEQWDPFEEPKDPLDIRMDRTRRTMNDLIREFTQSLDSADHGYDYRKGALEICLGIINEDERYLGMFDFACWYRDLLDRESAGK
ncbi:MAG: hypothetical protein K9K81_11425 [Desulfobacteraceae bacterium]|nr:hypothetical protein [Desulfobacteraceae bacterium]